MVITRKVDYGFMALAYIAANSNNNKRSSIHQIARAKQIPQKFLSTVLNDLVQARILISHQGPHGGYQLRKQPSKISFLDVINALGGEIQINACTAKPSQCNRKNCNFKPHWRRIQKQLDDSLKNMKISDVL